MLRLALTQLQKLVKKGSLHPAAHMRRCGTLIPLGGPALCGLNRRPYFTCRQKMIQHIHTLIQYCEATWITRLHTPGGTLAVQYTKPLKRWKRLAYSVPSPEV